MSNVRPSIRFAVTGIALFALIFLLIAWDLTGDYRDGAAGLHIFLEFGVLLLAATGIGMLLWRVYTTCASVRSLQLDLERVREESDRWRKENLAFIEGLGAAISSRSALTAFFLEDLLMPTSGKGH